MFVGTSIDFRTNQLLVSERINGKRFTNRIPLCLDYYVEDEKGQYTSIYGKSLTKIPVKSWKDRKNAKDSALENNIQTYELTTNVNCKTLAQYYQNCGVPDLHISYIDIETDTRGDLSSSIDKSVKQTPYPINAVSVYNNWEGLLYTLMLCPETLDFEEARKICDSFDNTILFNDEKKLINALIVLLEDADVISGFNSNFFDIPYIINRTTKLFGAEKTKEFCLWNNAPYKTSGEIFLTQKLEYELAGKWLADYLLLYIKHEQAKSESYKLDNIAFKELGERKVDYDGTLDDLYRQDYVKFIRYNRQDTMLVKKLEDKLHYIDIHNELAHTIIVPLDVTMGTVTLIDSSIIGYAHKQNMIVPDRNIYLENKFSDIVAPGAFVPIPKAGLTNNIFSFDMKALYPTTLRSLNMSVETIVAQIDLTLTRPMLQEKITSNNLWRNKKEKIPDWGAAWANVWGTLEYQEVMNQTDTELILDFNDGQQVKLKAKDIYDMIFNSDANLSISACGTIFSNTKKGLIPCVLEDWSSSRNKLQNISEDYEFLKSGAEISEALLESLKGYIPPKTNATPNYDLKKLNQLISENRIEDIKAFMIENNLVINENRIEPFNTTYYGKMAETYYIKQYTQKIKQNSLYGALLNSASLFYDWRLGASTTLSGRKVWQHLASKANEIITGNYNHTGISIIGGDTDSSYVSIDNQEFKNKYPDFKYTKSNIIKFADATCKEINISFSPYMKKTFHTTEENSLLERASREVVATKGLFVKKKKYALMVIDKDGVRKDVHGKTGSLKITGLQVKRADTPEIIKKLLNDMLIEVLSTSDKNKVKQIILNFYHNNWQKLSAFEQGTPKKVNNLDGYASSAKKSAEKVNMPGHVRASLNWNTLLDFYKDTKTPKIHSGDNVIVCKVLKSNQFGISSIAIPIDIPRIPKWFKELPFDKALTEETMIDNTINTIFGVLNWDLQLVHLLMDEDTNSLDNILTYDF